jgi:hypothetical protein
MSALETTIPILSASAAAIWGIYVFSKQQRFKRLQNLSQILQRFADNKEFLQLFNLFDQSLNINRESRQITYNEEYLTILANHSSENKLQFLVLLEEVALYAKSFEVDRDYAIHLFQWHFYYVYNNPNTSNAFWENLGGQIEIHEPYWEYQKSFSLHCNPVKSYRL